VPISAKPVDNFGKKQADNDEKKGE